jgi:hypothetical protein
MKTGHLILTRLAIRWIFDKTSLSWDKWLHDSIRLMDTYCRPSLKQQTSQDSELLTFVDNSVNNVGNKLDNEHVIKISNDPLNYPKMEMIDAINQYIKEQGYDAVIITRLDRDDCLRKDFIQKLKQYCGEGLYKISKKYQDRLYQGFPKLEEKYIDIRTAYTYSENDKIIYESDMYKKDFCSPFVSTYERVKDGKIVCYPFAYMHPHVPKFIDGIKVNDLFAMQVIHNHNLSNQMHGKQTEINLKDYF